MPKPMTSPHPATAEAVAPDVLAKQVADAASDMCEIARIVGEWRHGPKQSLTAVREIRACLAAKPPASGVDAADEGSIAHFLRLLDQVNHYHSDVRGDAHDDLIRFCQRHAEALRASLSPAATSGSEAGGGPTYVVNCCNCGRIIDTREEDAGGDGWGHELSDERWVCSPECLDAVSGEPASSPAGGDVREAGRALVRQLRAIMCHLNGQAYSSTLSALNAFDAALSPSTSAAEPVVYGPDEEGLYYTTNVAGMREACDPPAPAAVDGQRVKVRDWLAVARAAGQHGVRYRTNRALEAFLSEIRACLATDKERA